MYKIKTICASTREMLDSRANKFLEDLGDYYAFVDIKISVSEKSSYYVEYYTAVFIMKYIFVRKVLTEKIHV